MKHPIGRSYCAKYNKASDMGDLPTYNKAPDRAIIRYDMQRSTRQGDHPTCSVAPDRAMTQHAANSKLHGTCLSGSTSKQYSNSNSKTPPKHQNTKTLIPFGLEDTTNAVPIKFTHHSSPAGEAAAVRGIHQLRLPQPRREDRLETSLQINAVNNRYCTVQASAPQQHRALCERGRASALAHVCSRRWRKRYLEQLYNVSSFGHYEPL